MGFVIFPMVNCNREPGATPNVPTSWLRVTVFVEAFQLHGVTEASFATFVQSKLPTIYILTLAV